MPKRAFFYTWCKMTNQANQPKATQGTKTKGIRKAESSEETKLVRKQSGVRASMQFNLTGGSAVSAVAPSFDPLTLLLITQSNNTLLQCVEAMEVNVDGTGCEVVSIDGEVEVSEDEKKRIGEILDEPYPDMTFITMRRKIRRDLESSGMAYLEVIRAASGDFIGFRPLDTQACRLTTLSAEVMTSKSLVRNGVEQNFDIPDRERGVVYKKSEKDTPVYFNIWGNTQKINKKTGEMSLTLEDGDKGGDVIVFTMNDDPETPYGIPRWINQLPSALGSRKAEEQNLDFLDSGGIPAAIIFINGGQVATDSSSTLKDYVSGKNRQKNKAVVVELQSTSGTIDKAGSTSVQVERFGSETINDSMYRNYDKDCEEHVRLAFRLPPIFLGKASDYNYATAVVAYQVAEAQVFKPERDEFDAIINKVLKTELKLTTCKIKSNPITLRDITTQLRAVSLLREVVEPSEVVKEVNKIADISLPYVDGKTFTITTSRGSALGVDGVADTSTASTATKVQKSQAGYVLNLAKQFAECKNLIDTDNDYTEEEIADIETAVKALKGADLEAYNSALSLYLFGTDTIEMLGAIQ